jgi:hypothetical protein
MLEELLKKRQESICIFTLSFMLISDQNPDQKGEPKNGVGKYTFPNGDIYLGDFANEAFNGEGIYLYQNGERYEGTL